MHREAILTMNHNKHSYQKEPNHEATDAAVKPPVPLPSPAPKKARRSAQADVTPNKARGPFAKLPYTANLSPVDTERTGYQLTVAEVRRIFGNPKKAVQARILCTEGEENAQDVIIVADGHYICAFVPMVSKRGTLLRLLQNGFFVTGASPSGSVLHVVIRLGSKASVRAVLEELAEFPLPPEVLTYVPQP